MTEHNTITGTELHEAFHYVSASDPGAVGANLYWLDTSSSPYILKKRNGTNTAWVSVGASGAGDFVGPGLSTDNAVVRFDGTTGKLGQTSLLIVDDSGGVNIPTGQTYNINGSPHTHSGGSNSFSTITVSGQSDVVADSSTDTLTLVAGSNITITTNAGSDSITITASGGSSGIGWTQVVNEPGTSFTNFTGTAGTWSSDGTIIKNTNTGPVSRARYNTRVLTNAVIFEAELKTISAGSNRTGLVVGYDGTNTSGIGVYINEGNNAVYVEQDGNVALTSFAATIDANTWYKLRLVVFGREVAIYLDGTLIGSVAVMFTSATTGFVGLYSYQVESHFRNIKAWTLSGFPA